MEDHTEENGMKTTWKVLENILGLTREYLMVNIKMIKSTDTVFINGQMEESTMETGLKVNNMD